MSVIAGNHPPSPVSTYNAQEGVDEELLEEEVSLIRLARIGETAKNRCGAAVEYSCAVLSNVGRFES